MYHFSEKYGYSNGKMYIALVDEKLAGCVALTKMMITIVKLRDFILEKSFVEII